MGIIYQSVLAGISRTYDVDHDPTVTSTDTPSGSIITQYDDTGSLPVYVCTFVKLSDGDNTDVGKIRFDYNNILTSRNTGQVLVSMNTGNVLRTG